MIQAVWRISLAEQGYQEVRVPKGSSLLSIQIERSVGTPDKVIGYFLVNSLEEERERFIIMIVETNITFEDELNMTYLCTFQHFGPRHVFYTKKPG